MSPVLLYDSKNGGTIESVSCLKSSVIVTISENVQTSLHQFSSKEGSWNSAPLSVAQGGTTGLIAASAWRDDLFISQEDFVSPTTLFYRDSKGELLEIKSLPHRFSAEGIEVQQLWAISKDGTKIPYYI